MSARVMQYTQNISPANAADMTLMQIVAPANQRIVLRQVQVGPIGATGATGQLEFDIVTQTNANGLTADSGSIVEQVPVATSGSIQTVANKKTSPSAADEPAGNSVLYQFELHQQASRVWVPPTKDPNGVPGMVLEPGTRVAVRSLNGSTGFAIKCQIIFEE